MKFYASGYCSIHYDQKSLKERAQQIAQVLPDLMKITGADGVVVTGKSGMALAFATLMFIDFPLVVVRKSGESHHGSPIEGDGQTDITNYLILDDFIATGATVNKIAKTLNDHYAELREESQQRSDLIFDSMKPPRCVGVLSYDMESGGSHYCHPVWPDDDNHYRVTNFSLRQLCEEGMPIMRNGLARRWDDIIYED